MIRSQTTFCTRCVNCERLAWLYLPERITRADFFEKQQFEQADIELSWHGRLIGNGFPPVPTKSPPADTLDDPVMMCRQCCKVPVLPAVPGCERGLCYYCHGK